jgi:hypothetical protein
MGLEQIGYEGGHPLTVIDDGDRRAGQHRGVDRHQRRRNGHEGDTLGLLGAMFRSWVGIS